MLLNDYDIKTYKRCSSRFWGNDLQPALPEHLLTRGCGRANWKWTKSYWRQTMWREWRSDCFMMAASLISVVVLTLFVLTADASSNCSYSPSNDSLHCIISSLQTIRSVTSHSSGTLRDSQTHQSYWISLEIFETQISPWQSRITDKKKTQTEAHIFLFWIHEINFHSPKPSS